MGDSFFIQNYHLFYSKFMCFLFRFSIFSRDERYNVCISSFSARIRLQSAIRFPFDVRSVSISDITEEMLFSSRAFSARSVLFRLKSSTDVVNAKKTNIANELCKYFMIGSFSYFYEFPGFLHAFNLFFPLRVRFQYVFHVNTVNT